jgi:hypothetical protein
MLNLTLLFLPYTHVQLYMNCVDVTIENTIMPAAQQQLTGRRTVFANQPGYPSIPEFISGYDGSDIYAAAPTITITAQDSSVSPSATPSAPAPAVSPSGSPSRPASALSPSSSPSRAAIVGGSPAPVSPVLPSGNRILDYLHARGEALDITTPSPVKAVYVDYRDSAYNAVISIMLHFVVLDIHVTLICANQYIPSLPYCSFCSLLVSS